MIHRIVALASAALAGAVVLTALPAHTPASPVIEQVGGVKTDRLALQPVTQPLLSVIVTEYVPAVLTLMQAVLAAKFGPVHEYVAPTRLVAQNWAV